MSQAAIGIVIALAAEARALTPLRLGLGTVSRIDAASLAIVCGMGPRAAREAALLLADRGASALAVFGVAGALDPLLGSGTLLCPTEVLDEAGARYATDGGWRERLGARLAGLRAPSSGALLTVREPLLTALMKAQARERHGAVGVDMESAAVAAVAQERGLPLLVLRAIADAAEDAIPAALAGAVDRWGRAQPQRLAPALLRSPQMLPTLPRLGLRMARATRSLRLAAAAAGPALAYGP